MFEFVLAQLEKILFIFSDGKDSSIKFTAFGFLFYYDWFAMQYFMISLKHNKTEKS